MRRAAAVVLLSILAGPAPAWAGQLLHVPGDVATLGAALAQVVDGGVIEMAAGTYLAPAGAFGIYDTTKTFTIRAAPGASVTLSGGGTRDILRFANSAGKGRPVTFQGLTFANGRSNAVGVGGAITLRNAQATFEDCAFVQNRSDSPGNGGGAVLSDTGSSALFRRCSWLANSAWRAGGAILAYMGSRVYIDDSELTGNQTNKSGHSSDSFGGAIAIADSLLRVTDTRFDSNDAGYVGGAVYALGSWADPVSTPSADLLITNSSFVNNRAAPAAGITPPSSPVGGAIHVEDQTTLRIHHSRFEANRAVTGGAVSCFRCILQLGGSVFRGNVALGGVGEGLGGAVLANSDDNVGDATNHRSVSVTVTDTLFDGAGAGSGGQSRLGGCIFAGGDEARAFGLGGVTPNGSVATNRATVVLDEVVFSACDVIGDAGMGGAGGALAASLANVTLTDSLVIGSHATATAGATANGGGLALYDGSTASIDRTIVAGCSALSNGGALWVSGSNLVLANSTLAENSLTSGTSGSALYAAPQTAGGGRPAMNVTGSVSGNVISNNSGPSAFMIMEGDYAAGPINELTYAANQFYPNDTFAFLSGLAGAKNAAGLNSLVVHRTNGTTTIKSPGQDNVGAESAPIAGGLRATPHARLASGAAGDPAGPTESDLAYAWTGVAQATLDGQPRSGKIGLEPASTSGAHALAIGPQVLLATVADAPVPRSALNTQPWNIAKGGTSMLAWTTVAGTFLDQAFDQGVTIPSPATASGAVLVKPVVNTTYRGFLVTEEGGDVAESFVVIQGTAPVVFQDGFESGGLSDWSDAVGG